MAGRIWQVVQATKIVVGSRCWSVVQATDNVVDDRADRSFFYRYPYVEVTNLKGFPPVLYLLFADIY